QTLELLPLYQEMIVTGAWWDHVDGVAHRIGALLLAFPSQMRPTILAWSHDPDRWLRRTSIICQLDAMAPTDLTLLSTTIRATAASRATDAASMVNVRSAARKRRANARDFSPGPSRSGSA